MVRSYPARGGRLLLSDGTRKRVEGPPQPRAPEHVFDLSPARRERAIAARARPRRPASPPVRHPPTGAGRVPLPPISGPRGRGHRLVRRQPVDRFRSGRVAPGGLLHLFARREVSLTLRQPLSYLHVSL